MRTTPPDDTLLAGLPRVRPNAARTDRTRLACRELLIRQRRRLSQQDASGLRSGKRIMVGALVLAGALYVAELVVAALTFRNVLQ
jgi:hypothetical protein